MHAYENDNICAKIDATLNRSMKRILLCTLVIALAACFAIFVFAGSFRFIFNAFNKVNYPDGNYTIISDNGVYCADGITVSISNYHISDDHIDAALLIKNTDTSAYDLNIMDFDVFVLNGSSSQRCMFKSIGHVPLSSNSEAEIVLSVDNPPEITENSVVTVFIDIPGSSKKAEFLLKQHLNTMNNE